MGSDRRILRSLVLTALLWSLSVGTALAQCGGVERWAVKMGSDAAASEVNVQDRTPISITEINALPDPRARIPKGDNDTRLEEERKVFEVKGFLRLFKFEKDRDFHLVITDSSLKHSKGGQGSKGKETGTSFIAEIPDPKCFMGAKNTVSQRSTWEDKLREVRDRFDLRFPGGEGEDDLMTVPVTIVGVAFFDRDHGQIGRARNGFELHPLLSITFDDEGAAVAGVSEGGQNLLTNSGFEDGDTGWKASKGVIDSGGYPHAGRGDSKAVLGDRGEAGTTSLHQTVGIPATAASVKLSYLLRVRTGEPVSPRSAVDKLFVQIRTGSGEYIETVATYSNLDRSRSYKQHEIDLNKHKGKTIRIHFKSQEDSDKATAFYVDDVELWVK